MKHIDVVAAVIVTENGILTTQRSHGEFKDKWEFPGGKIEPGETPEQALKREIKEELDVDISIDSYIEKGHFALTEKHVPHIVNPKDAIVRVTLGSICTSDLHIKHGSVPRAVPGITVGHEMVGLVEQVGSLVSSVKPGDRVTVNVETFCGECFFCRNGYVNNCEDPDGGWALGCHIDGGQTEYVRVPHADMGLNRIPDGVTLL